MESNQYNSTIAFVESLVRSAPVRGSQVRGPVSNNCHTNFSIRSILGLENGDTDVSSLPGELHFFISLAECHRTTSPPLSPYSDCASPNDRRRQASPVLTPYSDTTSSSSDCDSETYRVPNATEKPQKKKRQRTTFSQHEKMQLEMAFRRQPYLMGNDEGMLAERLGITIQNVRYWFQNRRAKLRKLQKEMMPVYQTSPSNQFERVPESRTTIPRRLQFSPTQPDSDHWRHATYLSYRYPPMTENRLITSASNHPSIQLNQFRREIPVPFPTPNSNQCTIRRVEPARVARRSSRTQRSFHPYWTPY
ncbi:homeobox protein zampogna-like [Acropora muricata]|uniref:homeobox protein zampogna-like n=1 Tax=Acropora muricata TaxID=159855 RepID=UPI0034E591E9